MGGWTLGFILNKPPPAPPELRRGANWIDDSKSVDVHLEFIVFLREHKMAEITPMMKQYWDLKKQVPNAILFFRVGDFYEMFHEDAILASKTLEIVLTTRDKNKENAIPLCGVPFHAASSYIQKLIKAGHCVAVCEQTEDPASAKGLVKREVLRVITPGTLIEPELLSPKENNYIAALYWDFRSDLPHAKEIGLAFLDLSTGEFKSFQAEAFHEVESELSKMDPKEIVLPALLTGKEDKMGPLPNWPLRFISPLYFMKEEAYSLLTNHFHVHSISALGNPGADLIAAGGLLAYVKETQKGVVGAITSLLPHPFGEFMRIHPLAQRHLNLVPKTHNEKNGTLLQVLDKTVTAMGGRLLRSWLLHPLLSPTAIAKRQEGVAYFHQNLSLRQTCRDLLQKMADIERLIGRISLKAANPRDLVALKNALFLLPEIGKAMTNNIQQETIPMLIETVMASWDNVDEVALLIDHAIANDPPFSLKEGGVICEGYLAELDEIRNFRKKERSLLTEIELRERQRTGIESLKVRYNQVFGYYIEVSETHLKKIPEDYIRKQTLTRAERFTTSELKATEDRLIGAQEKMVRLERAVFDEVCETVSQQARRIQEMAQKIATLDLFLSFSELAHQNRYVCPEVNAGLTIQISEGRHPVLDTMRSTFVSNDTLLDPPTDRLLLITGPNMAGKSTYMQQVALIVLMAQIGSFVPASEATIGVVDQIFARVGAEDALLAEMSTFMVEMTEMAQILRQSTPKSLILLDELGRGTSTFDGISIAWAIAEYIHHQSTRTLFATHYHELTQLSRAYEGIRNYHVLIREWNEEIIFMHKVVPGGADKSYGIEVGRLAGLPAEIIMRAKQVLQQLSTADFKSPLLTTLNPVTEGPGTPAETGTSDAERDLFNSSVSDSPPQRATPSQASLSHSIIKTLQSIDSNAMTPIQAIQILADLSEQAKKEKR